MAHRFDARGITSTFLSGVARVKPSSDVGVINMEIIYKKLSLEFLLVGNLKQKQGMLSRVTKLMSNTNCVRFFYLFIFFKGCCWISQLKLWSRGFLLS